MGNHQAAPLLCMIFEATGSYDAIGKIAMAQVEDALDAGWRGSVVAERLDESLQGERVDAIAAGTLIIVPTENAEAPSTAIRRRTGDAGRQQRKVAVGRGR